MALIVGFPGFLSDPNAADVNAAAQKLTEQIGGVMPDGTIYPGNIDGQNLLAAAGFRNEQKNEPYAEFGISVGYDGVLSAAWPAASAPLPFDAVLVGVGFRQFVKHTGRLAIYLGALEPLASELAEFDVPSAAHYQTWDLQGAVPAGTMLGALATFSPAAADPWIVTFFLKAKHVG